MKKEKIPHLIYLAALTTITVIMWAAFSTYRVLTEKPSPSLKPEVLTPFSANFPEEKLGDIKNRVFFDESSITAPSSTPIPSPTSTPKPTTSATPLFTVSPSPTP